MRKMLEKDFWKEIRDHMPEVHWQRIETWNNTAGVPDVNGCRRGVEVWLELKVYPNKPTPKQWNWIRQRNMAGGHAYAVTAKPKTGEFLVQMSEDGGSVPLHSYDALRDYLFS